MSNIQSLFNENGYYVAKDIYDSSQLTSSKMRSTELYDSCWLVMKIRTLVGGVNWHMS